MEQQGEQRARTAWFFTSYSDAADTSIVPSDPLCNLPSRSLLIPAPVTHHPRPPIGCTTVTRSRGLCCRYIRAEARRIPQSALQVTALRKFSSTRTHAPKHPRAACAGTGRLRHGPLVLTTAKHASSLWDQQPHRTCFIGRWCGHGLGLDRQPSRPQPQPTIVNTTRVASGWRDPCPSLLTRCNKTLRTASRIHRLHLPYTGHIHHIPCNPVRCYLHQLYITQIQGNDTVS